MLELFPPSLSQCPVGLSGHVCLWMQQTFASDAHTNCFSLTSLVGIEVRLVNGSVSWEGRVEVRDRSVSDTWGTVCDDNWENQDATVVCRHLGIGHNGTAKKKAFFGMGSGPIYLDEVNCTGTEKTLGDCTAVPWGSHNCQHKDDAGVVCQPGCDPGTFENTTSRNCIPCPPGTYQNKRNSTKCDLCSPGHYQNMTGQTSCATCSPGHYQNKSGQASCVACLPGHYQNITGQSSCHPCPPGSFQYEDGQMCAPCLPGEYQAEAGQSSCRVCPAGHYQSLAGQSSCLPCPKRTSTSRMSSNRPVNCTTSPAPFATVTLTMTYTLPRKCTHKEAEMVHAALTTRVHQLETYIPDVCVDPACSNTRVETWCHIYIHYSVNSKIHFSDLPMTISMPNGTDALPDRLLLQTVKDTRIFDILTGEARLQKDSMQTSWTTTCPQQFKLIGNTCVYWEGGLQQMISTVVGCCTAAAAVIFLTVVLLKLKKRVHTSARKPEAATDLHETYHYRNVGDSQPDDTNDNLESSGPCVQASPPPSPLTNC